VRCGGKGLVLLSFVRDWMVADAVCDELVSALKSLITGKIQGNFGKWLI
jgi:hypothetical protein